MHADATETVRRPEMTDRTTQRLPPHTYGGQRQRRGADVTPTIEARELSAVDRCDRCGAQAYVRTVLGSGPEWLFCAHHGHDNESRLREIAISIHDQTDQLADVPEVAALDER